MVLVFVTFWYFYYFVKFVCGIMLVKCLKQLTFFNSLQLLGFFMSVLHAFCYHLNIILIHFYWLLLRKSVLRFPTLLSLVCGNQLFEFYQNSTDWLPHDAGSGCGESQKRLVTVLYPFFSFVFFNCTLLLYSSFAVIFWVRVFQTF